MPCRGLGLGCLDAWHTSRDTAVQSSYADCAHLDIACLLAMRFHVFSNWHSQAG